MPGTKELIAEILNETLKRDVIAYGMKQRALLEPASRFAWNDPREADGVPILARRKISGTDLNQRLHVPFDKMIATNKAGYFASDIQVTFGMGVPANVSDYYQSLRDRAHWKAMTLQITNNAITQGSGYLFMTLLNSELRYSVSPTCSTVVVYDPVTHEPVYGMRYDAKTAELYDGMEFTRWTNVNGTWTQGETRLHGLGTVSRPMVPIIEFRDAPDRIGNPERVITLCDAYDVSLSDLGNELAALRLSYLLLKGLGENADVIKEQLKDAGVIILDSENADARYISKNLNPEAVRLLQDNIRSLIFDGASSYDPASFTEGTSPTAYEVSQRLAALEMDVVITIGEFDTAFRQMDYLIQTYLMTFRGMGDYPLWEIDRIYRRTAPRNMIQALVEAKNAGIVLSNKTLIELSGLQISADEEAGRLSVEPVETDQEIV